MHGPVAPSLVMVLEPEHAWRCAGDGCSYDWIEDKTYVEHAWRVHGVAEDDVVVIDNRVDDPRDLDG